MMYNLDVVIAIGYRVNSYEATKFRIWATSVLKEYLTKGVVLDDERLRGKSPQIFNMVWVVSTGSSLSRTFKPMKADSALNLWRIF